VGCYTSCQYVSCTHELEPSWYQVLIIGHVGFGLFETFRDILDEYRGKTDFASRVGIGAIRDDPTSVVI
jgi:hypothetical protein